MKRRNEYTDDELIHFPKKTSAKVRIGEIGAKVKGYTTINLKRKSSWGDLTASGLRDESGRFLENLWQFSKVYRKLPEHFYHKKKYGLNVFGVEVNWKNPIYNDMGGIFIDNEDFTERFWEWRINGYLHKKPIRYAAPPEYKPLYWMHPDVDPYKVAMGEYEKITNEVMARKVIDIPLYEELVQNIENLQTLKQWYNNGENLLLCSYDAPKKAFMYGTETMLATNDNLDKILYNIEVPYREVCCLARLIIN